MEEGRDPRTVLLQLEAGPEVILLSSLLQRGRSRIVLKDLDIEFDHQLVKRESVTAPWVRTKYIKINLEGKATCRLQ
jgi:hypothetical protein